MSPFAWIIVALVIIVAARIAVRTQCLGDPVGLCLGRARIGDENVGHPAAPSLGLEA
jgi:hypothetical protein